MPLWYLLLFAVLFVVKGQLKECLSNLCPTQYKTCDEDANCWPAIGTCEKRCTGSSVAACWSFCLGGKPNVAAIKLSRCGMDEQCIASEVKPQ